MNLLLIFGLIMLAAALILIGYSAGNSRISVVKKWGERMKLERDTARSDARNLSQVAIKNLGHLTRDPDKIQNWDTGSYCQLLFEYLEYAQEIFNKYKLHLVPEHYNCKSAVGRITPEGSTRIGNNAGVCIQHPETLDPNWMEGRRAGKTDTTGQVNKLKYVLQSEFGISDERIDLVVNEIIQAMDVIIK